MGLQKPKKKPERPEWIAVHISHNLQEAHIISGKLSAFDIPSMIHTVPGASAIGITYGNLGEIKVLVHPNDYERAQDILNPDSADQLEESNDKVQYIWQDDGDGVEYYIEEDEEDDE